MTNLNSRSALHPFWTKVALPVLEAFEACIIAIYDPNSELSGDAYDPFAPLAGGSGFGEGGFGEGAFGGGSGSGFPGGTSAPIALWAGAAQMQVYRQSLTVDDVAGSVTQIRSVRFTLPIDAPAVIRKGLIVRVLSAENDPSGEQYEYTVTSGMNSPLAWKRTIEAEADQAVVVGPIILP